jgi:hypothetical protein
MTFGVPHGIIKRHPERSGCPHKQEERYKMDVVLDMLSRGFEQLLGRARGPLHFRLVIMPTVVTILAIRAGLQDAREGQPAFPWAVITNPAERQRRLLSARKDITRIFIVALVLDTVYQLTVFRTFYLIQTLIVAVVCAIVPYVLVRGPVTCLTRGLFGGGAARAKPSAVETDVTEGRREDQNGVEPGGADPAKK